jgi:hypothetical protein
MFATPLLIRRALQDAAKLRGASSSVVSVASGYEHSCVSLNADAYRISRLQSAALSESDR